MEGVSECASREKRWRADERHEAHGEEHFSAVAVKHGFGAGEFFDREKFAERASSSGGLNGIGVSAAPTR